MTKSPEHTLTEDQAATLVNPRSREVFEAFVHHGAMSVVQLQDVLGFPSKTLYYQVKKLARTGLLIQKSGSKGRARPAVYEPVARLISFPRGFLGARFELLAAELAAASLRKEIRNFRSAAAASKDDPSLADLMHLTTLTLRLHPKDVGRLNRRLVDVLEEFRDSQSPDARGRVSVIVSISPADVPD